VQFINAQSYILFNLVKFAEDSLVPANADIPIVSITLFSLIFSKDMQLKNASSPIKEHWLLKFTDVIVD
jgi:hypothetical protein